MKKPSLHPRSSRRESAAIASAKRFPLPSRVLSALFLLFAAASLQAADSSTNALGLHTDLPDVGVSVIRTLAGLAIVLAVFFGGLWLFRNGQRAVWRKNGAPRLNILESRPLGNRLAIYVVGYDEQRLLIGSSPAGLNLLSQLPPGTTPAPAPAPAPASASGTSFGEQLQRLLKRA